MTQATTSTATPQKAVLKPPTSRENGEGKPARASTRAAPPTDATGKAGPRFKLRVLRQRCKDCIGGPQKATRCDQTDCALWDHRTGHRPKGHRARRTPLRALRAYCLWCCNDSPKEVRLCASVDCPLWPWRMGRATGENRPAGAETGGVEGE